MSKTGYLVASCNFEYNDEYFCMNDGYHSPVIVYLDKEAATKKCKELNLCKFGNVDLAGYIVDGDWYTIFDDPNGASSRYALNLDEPYNIVVPRDEKLLEKFVDECLLSFYKVVEVEVA